MIPCVLYARRSTDRQAERSTADQLAKCREFAERNGYEVVGEYADEAISGSTMERDQLQALLAAATATRRPPFRAVIVESTRALSRDIGDTHAIVFRQLAGAGVKLLDTFGLDSESDSGEMTIAMQSIVNREYVRGVSKLTHRGMSARAKAGFAMGSHAYGFRSIVDPNADDPEHASKLRVIDEDEAVVVRRIYREFVEGRALKAIASTLNAEGVPAPLDASRRQVVKGWRSDTIRAILENPRYVGRFIWNQTKIVVGKRVPRPESEWIVVEDPALAIVDGALFDRVAARLKARRPNRPPGSGARRVYLTTGLLRCGSCGSSMCIQATHVSKGVRYASLGCINRKRRGEAACANGGLLGERRVTAGLLDALRAILARSELADAFVRGFEEAIAAAAAAPGPADAERRLREAEGRAARVAQAIARMPDSEALLAQLATEEAAVRTLRAEVAAARAAAGAPRVAPTREAVRAAFGAFLDALGEVAPEEGNALLRRALGDGGITVTPTRLRWECAGALRLGALLGYKGSGDLDPALR